MQVVFDLVNKIENIRKNNELRDLYIEKTKEFLSACGDESQNRINEFGIIDSDNYETDKGILFIGKETNGWGILGKETFLDWINDIITGKQTTKRPQIWYNLGRWAKFIANPEMNKEDLISERKDALSGLSKIAFTNVNKVGGGNVSGSEFWKLAENKEVREILKKEIDILSPEVIVLCGLKRENIGLDDTALSIIEMPHPSARNISKMEMIERLEVQMKKAR